MLCWNFHQLAPSIKNHLSDVVMFGLDMFESGLADISFLRVDHWLGIFVEFEGCFSENFCFVQELLDEGALHCGIAAPYGF